LVIKKNSFTGIIGKSGCGKSTFLDLFSGLLYPNAGEILIDNNMLTDENIGSWRYKIGYVPQSVYLFDSTIAENIAFNSEDDMDLDQVILAAKEADIHEYIIGLECGYNTMIGERGVLLSGGQKQRIGIARALYKNPEIILMDEATSALDNETALTITENLKKLSYSKTVIIIAHRKEALIYCDKILDFGECK
jgi:ATP-binding cassette, subfamily B, bacterial PglK